MARKFLDSDGAARLAEHVQAMPDGKTVEYSIDGSSKTLHVKDGGIATSKLADLSVTSSKVANLSIGTGKIANGAVTSGKVADSSISTSKIVDKAVTREKLADDILGDLTGASPGRDLADYSEADLSKMVNDESINTLDLKYLIGQERTISLSGYGDKTAVCIGVRADDKTGGGKVGMTLMFKESVGQNRVIDTSSLTYQFDGSDLDSSIERMFSSFPSEWRSIMVKADKVMYSLGNGTKKNIVSRSLTLISKTESGNDPEVDYGDRIVEGAAYELFATLDKSIGYFSSGGDSWTRSRAGNKTKTFVYYDSTGYMQTRYGELNTRKYEVHPIFFI